jgi:hypothetical protein
MIVGAAAALSRRSAARAFQASAQASTIRSYSSRIRCERTFSRRYCQTTAIGSSSGAEGGSAIKVMVFGMLSAAL